MSDVIDRTELRLAHSEFINSKLCCRVCKKPLKGNNSVYATCQNGCFKNYDCVRITTKTSGYDLNRKINGRVYNE